MAAAAAWTSAGIYRGCTRCPRAVWVVMTVLIAVTAAVAGLSLILDYRQKKLGIESAAG